jgi:hypothetical protein
MTSNNYVTYAENAIYTLYFTLSNYIPPMGVLIVVLPKEIVISGNPYEALSVVELQNFKPYQKGGYGTTQVYDVGTGQNVELFYINYYVPIKVPSGDYSITFGGLQNPRSFDATGVF